MEVHHHPDLHHKHKKWKEYVIEFFMIFIAVSMGFLAESVREHLTERSKEKKYMAGFVRNLKDDTTELVHVIEFQTRQGLGLDSLLKLSHSDLGIDSNRHAFYYFVTNYCYNSSTFTSNDATLQELKNTGDYRFIERNHVADTLGQFERNLQAVYLQGDYYRVYFRANLERLDEILDVTVLGDTAYLKQGRLTNKPLPLIRQDKENLRTFFNKIYVFRLIMSSYVKYELKPQLEYSGRLIAFLQQTYSLTE